MIQRFTRYIPIIKITILFTCCVILFSCNGIETVDVSQTDYIINQNTNIVHKTNCPTIANMTIKNKLVSNENIEDILSQNGRVACKVCRPDRNVRYITTPIINEFERVLHNEFGFGKDYTDKVLKCLSNLYVGIDNNKLNYYSSSAEYHRVVASICYRDWLSWANVAGTYTSESKVKNIIKKYYGTLKNVNKHYFDNEAIELMYSSVKDQHEMLYVDKNDFAHMSVTISAHTNVTASRIGAGLYAMKYNGISDIVSQCGFIGDICGANGFFPSMNSADYAADLDAVNLYKRYIDNKDKSIYELFTNYYLGIEKNIINRAKEFLNNITIEKINQYRELYSNYLQTNENFNYGPNNNDYINRMNYFDNFVFHLINGDQVYTPRKYYTYNEY